MTKKIEFDLDTKRAALHPNADLRDDIVRSVRASANGESIYEYEKRLKDIGVDF